jgi:hypothetical protein
MVAEGRAKLTLDGSQFTSELNTAGDKARGLERDLSDLGRSGSREFENLQKGAGSLGKSVNDVSGDFKRYEKAGTDASKNLGAEKNTLMGKIKQIGPAVAAAYAVKKIVDFGKAMMDAAGDVDDLSNRLGASHETVQTLGVIATKSGLEMSDFENAILKTSRSATEAQAGNESLAEAFDTLGISAGDLATMNNEQIFEKLTRAMADNAGDADVLAAAYDVIGTRAGPKLQTALIDIGEKGFAKLNEEMIDNNMIMSTDAIRSWDQLGDTLETATIKLKGWVGEYGGKFISGLKEGAEWLGVVTAGGNWDEYKASLEATTAEQERLNEKTREKAEADKQIREEKEAQEALLKEIADLEEKIKNDTVDTRTEARQISDLKRDIKQLTEDEENLSGTGAENYRDQLVIQNQIAEKRRELAPLEAAAQRRREAADREAEEAKNRIIALQRQLAQREQQAAEAGMEKEELLQTRMTQREALLQIIARAEAAAGGQTEETLRLSLDLLNVERDIKNLQTGMVEKQTEIKDLNKEQLDLVEQFRDVFAGMTEHEIDDLIAGLQRIATGLADLPEVGNLDWIDKISNLRFAGVTSGQARQMVRALTELINGLHDLPRVDDATFDFLAKLRDLEFRGLTTSQASQMVRALTELINGLHDLPHVDDARFDFLAKLHDLEFRGLTDSQARQMVDALRVLLSGVNNVDLTSLENVVALLQALDSLGIAGTNTNVAISLPSDFQGIPLVFSPEANTTLQSIDASLQTLAQLRGVVWA